MDPQADPQPDAQPNPQPDPRRALPQLELTDWRRTVAELYAAVRREPDPATGHARWRQGRDALFRNHPQSPLPAGDPLRDSGLPYWPYDAALRWDVELEVIDAEGEAPVREVQTANDGTIRMRRIGRLALPQPIDGTLDAWWLEQYGGGLFLPMKDRTAGHSSYGAGRYLLDTAKGADLGGSHHSVVVDLNFAYHPSCRYDYRWECPLAAPGNTIAAAVEAGERM